MEDRLYLDFETRSALDLTKTGVHKYAEHPTTDVMCLGYTFNEESPSVEKGIWLEPRLPPRIFDHIVAGLPVIAHNAPFELIVWNVLCAPHYKWPRLDPKNVICTMARAFAMGLPAALDGCAAALGIQHRKDMVGHRMMMKLCKPKVYQELPLVLEWHEEPADLDVLYAYCPQDVVVDREVDKRLINLSAKERRLWQIDFDINNRGVQVDAQNAIVALKLVGQAVDRLNGEMREATEHQVATINAHVQLKKWLISKGLQTKGVAKDDILVLLDRTDLPADCRRALEIRQEGAKSSNKKLQAMVDGECADGRLRGIFQYHGAATGRWAGRRVQPHNFPRGTGVVKPADIPDVFKALAELEDPTFHLESFYGPLLTVISDSLRGFMTSAEGTDLLAADFNAIEARVLGWLAGDQSVLQIFRTHGMVYEAAASDIFSIPINEVDKAQRQVGKVAVLALGYGGGVGAFQSMAKNHAVKMAPALPALWERALAEHKEQAMKRWATTGSHTETPKQEWIASELTKLAWRDAHEDIVRYWNNVENAAKRAVREPGSVHQVEPFFLPTVRWLMKGSFLFCQLPSGRCLSYPYPQLEKRETPWGILREMLTYKYVDSTTNKWVRGSTYGGSLVENITQAVARDVLAEAMVRCHEAGDKIVIHVHDELVIEHRPWDGKGVDFGRHAFEARVARVPEWAEGLPITAAGWRGKRYRK